LQAVVNDDFVGDLYKNILYNEINIKIKDIKKYYPNIVFMSKYRKIIKPAQIIKINQRLG